MTEQYLLTRLTKIGANLAIISKYNLQVTESNGHIEHFTSRNAIYKHYFERKYGDERKVGRKKPEYVKTGKFNY